MEGENLFVCLGEKWKEEKGIEVDETFVIKNPKTKMT